LVSFFLDTVYNEIWRVFRYDRALPRHVCINRMYLTWRTNSWWKVPIICRPNVWSCCYCIE